MLQMYRLGLYENIQINQGEEKQMIIILVNLVPIIVTIGFLFLRKQFVNKVVDKKKTITELILDLLKFILVYFVIFVTNKIFEINTLNLLALSIDSFLLILTSLVILKKENNEFGIKAFKATFCIIVILFLSIYIITTDISSETLSNIVLSTIIKVLICFFINVWGAISSKNKIKGILKIIKEPRKAGPLDYLAMLLLVIVFILVTLNRVFPSI